MQEAVQLTLKPIAQQDKVVRLQTTVSIPDAHYAAGELFDSIPISVATCPGAGYREGQIAASDELGAVEITISRTVGICGPQYSYCFARDVAGRLELTYTFDARDRDPYGRDPGFTFCRHDRGATVSGINFLLLPQEERFYRVCFDLSDFSEPALAVAGGHQGDFSGRYSPDDLKFIYYAFGYLTEYHREGSKLHVYSLDDDDKYFAELAGITGEYFDYMERFFHDEDLSYNIILYPSKRTRLTGTAQQRCCYLGFGAELIEELSGIENVLAHELVHNWCVIEDSQSLSSLYAEGTAEYYSCYMQYHTGRASEEEYVDAINRKLRDYYSNPFREGAYEETFAKSWTHAFAQRIPYSKGLVLLMQLDVLIRRKSDGKSCLDDVVLSIIDDARLAKATDWADFAARVNHITEGEAQAMIDSAMTSGLLLPPENYFGEDYELVETTVGVECEGFDYTVRFEPEKVIHGLIPSSNAEKAGLRNGDKILSMVSGYDSGAKQISATRCKVLRDGEELSFAYVARGENVSCWQYRKK